jgi:uncharacterized linocin/CFP29 family protein
MANGGTGNLGREKLPWEQHLWDRLDAAVHDEMKRILIARQFLPKVMSAPDALTVPADSVNVKTGSPVDSDNGLLQVNESAVTEIIEIQVGFSLTKQQVEREETLSSAVTLATRAANLLAQGEDLLINQGDDVLKRNPLFREGRIRTRAGPGPVGLANLKSLPDKDQVLDVKFTDEPEARYGEETFGVVGEAYSQLQGKGHYGPYALMLPPGPNADTRAPLKTTLIMPADRIASLVEGRFYGTGTLPGERAGEPDLLGVMLSWGGNTIDLVIGRDATVAFLQEDSEGLYRFRVFERFALRDKDPTSRFLLRFQRSPRPRRPARR